MMVVSVNELEEGHPSKYLDEIVKGEKTLIADKKYPKYY